MRVDHVLPITVVLFELLAADFALKPRIWFVICVSNLQVLFETPLPSELFPTVLALEGCRIPLKLFRVHSLDVGFFDGTGSAFVVTKITTEGSWISSVRDFVSSEQCLVLTGFPAKGANETFTKCFRMGIFGMILQENL